jgi:hypothetical protein
MKLSLSIQTWLFAFVLLFAQQTAALHALAHAFPAQATQQEQDLPAAKACSQCLALAEIQGALPMVHAPFVALLTGFSACSFVSSPTLVQIALGFSARAPPSFL